MLQTLMTWVTHGLDAVTVAGHAPQTALAAVMCAALINSLK
ncbi:YshB family small membrane protein [Candidatus Sodalis sp. SoCistrobi]|nr:YshB family small membrane protein [Candidatus Sodalis sp. SoCistrobi]